jgi:hypothetical protein
MSARNGKTSNVVFRSKNLGLFEAAFAILEEENPMTLRQLYYRLISAGVLANAQKEYKRLGSVMTRAREGSDIPRSWIVDHVRSTLKPSSWSGLADFAETVREAYRKDFWAGLDHHVEVFVEKDAVAGTVQPVTREYDIALRVCRGYSSVSFAGEIADLWSRIEKPIFAYYLGDFDPSGFDLERDLREKLARYSGRKDQCRDVYRWQQLSGVPRKTIEERIYANKREDLTTEDIIDELLREQGVEQLGEVDALRVHNVMFETSEPRKTFYWQRLAIAEADFEEFDLVRLPVKESDKRTKGFLKTHGDACAELDALPPTELRRRVQEAIESHIDQKRWAKLQRTEQLEQETLEKVVDAWQKRK